MEKQTIDYSIRNNEKSLIMNCLTAHSGNVKDSARELGITRATLYRKIKKYKVNLSFFRDFK